MTKRHRLTHRRSPRGASPGLLSVDPQAHPSAVHTMCYGPEVLEENEGVSPERLPELAGKHPVTWINVDGLGDAAVLSSLKDRFGLHDLAMEDVVNVGQRAKVEDYEDFFFIVIRMPVAGEKSTEQISMFLGRGILITFQEHPGDCLEPVRERIRKGGIRIRKMEADYLAYAVIDAIVDAFFPVLEGYSERLIDLEGRLLHDKPTLVSDLYDLKREIIHLRPAIRPLRELTNALLVADSPMISHRTQTFLRDCYDHALQLIDLLDTTQDLSSGLIELNRANAANRMNEVMKVLTIIATIFIPVTFVAGIYGMNFNPEASRWNMPELNWVWGYPAALGVMFAIVVIMLLFFRRKDWI